MLIGRCPRCRDATRLYRADDGCRLCEYCARTQRRYSRRYSNDGRPSLPTDGYNRLVWDIDKLL